MGGTLHSFFIGVELFEERCIHLKEFTLSKSEGDDFNQVLIKQEDLSELPRCGNEQNDSHVEAEGSHKQGWISASAGMTGGSGVTSNSTGNSKDWIPASAGMTNDATGTDQATDSNTIDVLVVYTQRVEDHEGGAGTSQGLY